ncbi:MAG: hypothetical protein JWO94_547 [Verrucomicrobiaceae bacterium]|nr:hypothetical protein [Verrucomicrobiaceae bacterium]
MNAARSILQRLIQFFLAHEPMRHPRWELVIMRVVLAMLLWDMHSNWTMAYKDPVQAVRLMVVNPPSIDVMESSQPQPNGLGLLVDFSFLSNDRVEKPLRVLTAVSLLLYIAGIPSVLSLAIPLFFCVGVATLKNSQGFIGHTAQVLHLVLLSVWLAGLWGLWQRRQGRALPWGFNQGQLEADITRQAVAAGYVVSGLTKLAFSHGAWFSSAKYLPLHIVKNTEMKYYDAINPAALKNDWLPQLMMEHPLLCQLLFGAALPLELFAFVALFNRRSAALFGIGLIAFHESVTQLMSLSFIFNKALLLVFFVAPWWWVLRKKGRPAELSGS